MQDPLILTISGTVHFAANYTPPLAVTPLLLSVIPGDGTERTGPATGRFQMGTIKEADDTPVIHGFRLRNANAKAVTVESLQESGFSIDPTASVSGERVSLPVTIPPGGELTINVSLDPSLYRSSRQHSVSVFLTGQTSPTAILEMVGTLQPSVRFSQPSLDFGTVPAGSSKTLPLTITMAPAFANAADSVSLLRFRSSNPDVHFRRLSITPTLPPIERDEDGDVITHVGPDTPPPNTTIPTVIKYEVTFSPQKSWGLLTSSAVFFDPTYPNLLDLQDASIPLSGMALGDVTATPPAINLSIAAQGRPRAGQATLTAKTPGQLEGATVKLEALQKKLNPDEFLSVALTDLPTIAGHTAPGKLLVVSLKPTAPPGNLQAHIVVSLKDGHSLVVPVSVFVVSSIPAK